VKLKKINIQAIRAYENPGDGIFDFNDKNNNPASFIAIYAPNGFGKTSFYDAIEWGFTNNIGRLTKDGKEHLQSAKNFEDDQYIIRNKNANDDIESFVEIYLDTQELPIVNKIDHKNIRKGQKDTKLDEKNTNPEFGFIRNAILSQDGINAFLKEDDSQIRYEKFIKSFGDIELSEQHKNLQRLLDINKKKEKSVENEIRKLNNEIDKNVDIDFIEKINTQIALLDKNFNSLEKISYPYTDHDLYDHQNELKKGMNKVALELNLTDKKINSVTEILSGKGKVNTKDYTKHKIEILKYKETISKLNKQLEIMIKADHLLNEKKNITNLITKEKEKLNTAENLLSNFEVYKLELEKIKSNNNNIETLKSSINTINDKTNVHSALLNKEKELYTIKQKQINNYINKLNESDELFEIINLKKEEAKSLKNTIKELEKLKKRNNFDMQENSVLIKSIDTLKQNIKNNIFSCIDELPKPFNELLNSLEKLQSEQSIISFKISKLNKRKAFENEVERKAHEFIQNGLKIIEEKDSPNCPLCSTNFNSKEYLIKKVLDHINTLSTNSRLNEEISSLNITLFNLVSRNTEKLDSINDLIEKTLSDIDRFDNLFLQKDKNITSKLNEFKDKFEKIIAETEELSLKTKNEDKLNYKKELSQLIDSLQEKQSNKLKAINQIEAELNESIINKSEKSIELTRLDNLHVKRERSDFLTNQQFSIEKLGLTNNVTDSELNQAKEKIISSLADLKNKLNKNLVESIPFDVDYKYNDKIPVEREISELMDKINDLEPQVLLIENIVSSDLGIEIVPGIHETINSILSSKLNSLKSQSIELESIKQKFDVAISYLVKAKPYLTLIENKKRISELKKEIELHIKVVRPKISKELNRISEYINNQINSFFYQDLINELYRRVDPHPDYVKIIFNCEMHHNEKPKLHVTCSTNENNKVIVPSLYFSTGQLNALSLCIFLAKALNVTNKEKESSDFILIDDPIQAMDGLNLLSTIDLLRGISTSSGKQIILSTHDESFYNLLKKKVPDDLFSSKFITLESHGKVC